MTNIEKWNYYLQDLESPQIFIDWSFYFMIGASLERRVCWQKFNFKPIFPNLYLVFIAGPGVGKTQAADVVKDLFVSLDTSKKSEDGEMIKEQLINRGPDSLTLRALTSSLAKKIKKKQIIPAEGSEEKTKLYAYSPMTFFASGELGALLKKESADLVRFLNQGWDCKDFNHETHGNGSDYIKNMCISLFGCATPEWIRSAVNYDILNEGLTARSIFVFANQPRKKKFILEATDKGENYLKEIKEHVKRLTELYGEIEITPEVRAWVEHWINNRDIRINQDTKLDDYYARKKMHLVKMAMCIHFADSLDLTLTVDDFERALDYLNKTEILMSYALSGMNKNPEVTTASLIMEFLYSKFNSDKPEFVLESEIIIRLAPEVLNSELLEKGLEYLLKTKQIKKDGIRAQYCINTEHIDYINFSKVS